MSKAVRDRSRDIVVEREMRRDPRLSIAPASRLPNAVMWHCARLGRLGEIDRGFLCLNFDSTTTTEWLDAHKMVLMLRVSVYFTCS